MIVTGQLVEFDNAEPFAMNFNCSALASGKRQIKVAQIAV
jgi:hypothetical protein